MIAEPLVSGAVHVTVAASSPGVTRIRGAAGTETGVTSALGTEAAPVPLAFFAAMLTV